MVTTKTVRTDLGYYKRIRGYLDLLNFLFGDCSFLFLHHEADELREIDAATAVLVGVVDHVLDFILRRVLTFSKKLTKLKSSLKILYTRHIPVYTYIFCIALRFGQSASKTHNNVVNGRGNM